MPRDAHSSSSCSVPLVQPRPGNGCRENRKLTVLSVGGVPQGPSGGVAGHREVRVELGVAVPVELCQLVCLHQEGELPHQPEACQNRAPGFIRSTATPGQPTIFLFYLRQPAFFQRNAGAWRRPTPLPLMASPPKRPELIPVARERPWQQAAAYGRLPVPRRKRTSAGVA